MVILDRPLHGSIDPDAMVGAPFSFGDCHSLLANCCSNPRVSCTSSRKYRPMTRKRRQMAFEMLRQMKQQQSEILSTRSKRRRNQKRFYKGLCCTGKIRKYSIAMSSDWARVELIHVNDVSFSFFFLELHISESQSSVYSPTMAAATAASKYKSRIPSAGLANELYFASHKPDGDNEKTTPVLLRDKRRAPQSPLVPTDTTPTSRRPISSPVRSNTYVLQQHNRVNNNNNNSANNHQINSINRKRTSPVRANQSSPSPSTPMALNRNRQAQQQRTYSNHERLPTPATATVESSATAPVTTHQQFAPRVHTPLASRRPAPIVKNTPVKVTTPNIPRPPRVNATNQSRFHPRCFLSLRI